MPHVESDIITHLVFRIALWQGGGQWFLVELNQPALNFRSYLIIISIKKILFYFFLMEGRDVLLPKKHLITVRAIQVTKRLIHILQARILELELSFPSPGSSKTQGLNPRTPTLPGNSYQLGHQGRPFYNVKSCQLLNFAFYKTIG